MRLIPVLLFLSSLFIFSDAAAQIGGKKKNKKQKGDKTEPVKQNGRDAAKLERLFLEAEKAKVIEDWETAIKNYREVIAADAKNSNAHFQLAQIYFNQNKLAEAQKEAEEAAKLDGSNKWYLEMLATIYMAQGKAKEAESTFLLLLKKHPNNPDYYLNLGYLYSNWGQYENAVKTYDQFEKNFGIDEQVVQEKKNLYLRMNKFNEAVKEIHKLVEEFPNEPNYMLMEADLYRAKGDFEKAKDIYSKVLVIEPDNPQAQLALAQINMRSDTPEQKKDNLKGIFENPKVSVDTKVSILLISYIQMNSEDSLKRKEALELAEILVSVHPEEAKAYAVQGDLYYLDGQNDKALSSYEKALSIKKDVFQVWQQVMLIYNLKKDWEKVLKIANEAMELFPNQAIIYLFKGGAEMQLKDYEKAVRSFSKGEKMSTEDMKMRAQFLANQGDAYHSLNKHAESDEAYEKALKLDPENAYVLNNYSYYLSLRKQNLEKAKQMSAYSNKLEPNNASFLDTYAWILFQMGNYSEAREWQEKAIKAEPTPSGTILEHYGDILFKLGKKAEALNYWKKAKEAGTDSDTLDKKIAEEKYVE
jgi:tetratricopeptide (TPR) repeat protein